MRAGAQIHKISLPVKTDYRILRQILYQCDLIILLFLFHQGKRFFPGKSKPLQLEAFLYNLFISFSIAAKSSLEIGLLKSKS